MKIELIRQKFNGTRGYKYKPFSWCCDKIQENPCIVFSDEVYTDDDIDDECTFPAFALWHSEVVKDWEQIGDYSWASLEVIDGEEIWVVANLVAKKKFDIEEALEDYQDHIETERRKTEEKNKKNH